MVLFYIVDHNKYCAPMNYIPMFYFVSFYVVLYVEGLGDVVECVCNCGYDVTLFYKIHGCSVFYFCVYHCELCAM